MTVKPCNPNALPCVQRVLDYFGQIEGQGILLGQHTFVCNVGFRIMGMRLF